MQAQTIQARDQREVSAACGLSSGWSEGGLSELPEPNCLSGLANKQPTQKAITAEPQAAKGKQHVAGDA